MPLEPRKYPEITLSDVDRPDYSWLTYSVCVGGKRSCGWEGWILEAIYQKDPELKQETNRDKLLPSDSSYRCPRCRNSLYRTGAQLRFEVSEDQSFP